MKTYTAYCRTFQAAMKAGNYLLNYQIPKILEGPGAILKLPLIIKANSPGCVLVVSGPHISRSGLLDPFLKKMQKLDLSYVLFNEVPANPDSSSVERGYHIYLENSCNAIVAVGGGSPIDCAKAIGARIARPDRSITQMQGLLKVGRKIPFFAAVPTTAGTGSETTLASVITDSATHHKASLNDPHLFPDYAVLDPELTIGLPAGSTAACGMDALCHAVEAFTNQTYNTTLENRMAIRAVSLIMENLPIAYQNGSDLNARRQMLRASFYAGRAFTRGCVGYVHAIGHTLSGLYNLPHGLAMAVILPHVLREYGDAVYPSLAILARQCNMTDETEKDLALNFISRIEEMNRQMNIPDHFDCIQEEDIDQMIEWAMAEANPLYPVPVIWTKEEFRRLIRKIM